MNKEFTFNHFSDKLSFEDNKKRYHELCKQHHPDKLGGNVVTMQEINAEWNEINTKEKFERKKSEVVNDFYPDTSFDFGHVHFTIRKKPRPREEKIITFKGRKFNMNDPEIMQKVSFFFGGLGLVEFLHTKEWKEHSKV